MLFSLRQVGADSAAATGTGPVRPLGSGLPSRVVILTGMGAAHSQRFGLPALLLAFAVISLWMAWSDLVNQHMRASLQWEAELAAAAEAGADLPPPTVVFRGPRRLSEH